MSKVQSERRVSTDITTSCQDCDWTAENQGQLLYDSQYKDRARRHVATTGHVVILFTEKTTATYIRRVQP